MKRNFILGAALIAGLSMTACTSQAEADAKAAEL